MRKAREAGILPFQFMKRCERVIVFALRKKSTRRRQSGR